MRTVQRPKRDWRQDAACATTDPDLFFPGIGDWARSREAKKICASCPVATQCRNAALANVEEHGIWGGLSINELRKIRQEAS